MGPLDKFILKEDSLTATATGFDLRFYSHWYRSLPISSLGIIKLHINGQPVAQENCELEYEGKIYAMQDLANHYTDWWFVLDPVVLHIEEKNLQLQQGTSYDVAFELGLQIPYVLIGKEEKPLLASARVTKKLLCS